LHTVSSPPVRSPADCLKPGVEAEVVPAKPVQGQHLMLALRLTRAVPATLPIWVDTRNAGYGEEPTTTATIERGEPGLRVELGPGPIYKLRLRAQGGAVCPGGATIIAYA